MTARSSSEFRLIKEDKGYGNEQEAEENVDLIIAAMAQSGHLVEVRKK